MVRAIVEKRFKDFSDNVPTTVKDCYRTGVPMVVVNMLTPVAPQIEFELIKALAMINLDERLTVKPSQVQAIAQGIFEDWPTLSVEDVALALRRGARGHFGKIWRIDAPVLNEWLGTYAEELATLQEMGLQEQVKEYDKIDYEAFKERLEKEREKMNGKRESRIIELSSKGQSAEFQTSQEVAIKKQLHLEWIRANYDPITGKPLEGWVSEEEYQKLQKP